ncbi:2-hydroxyglutaryl-CoA dehydratase [Oribacterium sp. C9]|uniref:2-hydroxyacyl-CoA dehydratase family protein n=1 Tax=Oribacterium sp. C9 TaxID=1943579 RepID=UPI00098FC57D|nr:2-hydroxyacyl-CoA dehydratase family protein [Oribacterium sp. C9]OON85964.1 2-hydroxyglutaryl-CoA dehydratase [Oribacterium sp. C9]
MSEEKKIQESKSTVVKKLKATKAASLYQKEWFFSMKEQVEKENGEFAILNADVPMEIFRAMDIPFVVNQWWAAICGAKRMTKKYFDLMKENGYRPDLNSYDAQTLAESFDPDDKKFDEEGNPLGPWGGLPKPTICVTRLTGDVQSKIFTLLAENYGAEAYLIENTVARKTPLNWYELSADRWEEMYDTDRLDFAVQELKELIRWLEMKTGRMFDINKLQHVMNLINEQEGYYKKIRDLIAETHPVPVTVVDTINAVMQAQWQRGTEWGVQHAKGLYEEIKALVDKGEAAVPGEKLRMMWLGRGMWQDFQFYQRFEEKYGAVFMWSMYLAMGADAYIRNDEKGDPLRALAARFIGMEDFIHMPPWNSSWFIHEAKHNDIDGVVYMIPDNDMQAVEGSYFIKKAMEEVGIPILTFHADPVNPKKWNAETMTELVEDFIEKRVIPAHEAKTAK